MVTVPAPVLGVVMKVLPTPPPSTKIGSDAVPLSTRLPATVITALGSVTVMFVPGAIVSVAPTPTKTGALNVTAPGPQSVSVKIPPLGGLAREKPLSGGGVHRLAYVE